MFLKKFITVSAILGCAGTAGAQNFPNNLAANSVDPVSDSISIADMRMRLDSIRRTQNRPTVALVLSGGGAKGAAYIGLFRYLEEAGIPVDMLCGTSMGGLMSGLYSLGYDSHELEGIIRKIDWKRMMSDNIDLKFLSFERRQDRRKYILSVPFYYEDEAHAIREEVFDNLSAEDDDFQSSKARKKLLSTLPVGYINGFNVENMLSDLSVGFHEEMDFKDLPVPFFCVSSDLVSAKANYHTKGSILKAIRSTISIPGVFAPVRANGRILVDGGTRNNFPVDIAKAMGADIIIGVEVAKRGTTYSKVNNVVDIVNCMITMLGDDARSNKSFVPDMLIKPETGNMNMLSFNSDAISEMIAYGYAAAKEREADFLKIKQQLGDFSRPAAREKKALNLYNNNVFVSDIKVNGIDENEQKMIGRILDLDGNREMSRKDIEDGMCRLMASGAFEKVNYSLLNDADGNSFTLIIDCVPGQVHKFGFGFRLDTEEMAELLFNLRLNAGKLKGWRFDATAKISAQQDIELTASYIPDGFAQINFKTTAGYIRSDIQTESKNVTYNIAVFDTKQELYLSTIHGQAFDIRGGLRHEYASIPINMPLYSITRSGSALGSFSELARKGQFLTAFANIDINTLNDRQFPTRGFLGGAGFEYDFADLQSSSFNPVPIFNIDALWAIPVTQWFTLTPSFYYRSYFSDVDIYTQPYSHIHNNFLGGAMRGRYMAQQLPFVGFGDISEMHNHVYTASIDARFQLGKKLFLSGIGAVVKEVPTFAGLLENFQPSFWGCGLELGYRTLLGPVKFNLHWSDSIYVKGLSYYLSIGYDF